MEYMMPPAQKIGLALGGGSTYGIAHIGALKALTEHHIPIDCISGTSAGSIVAACFAFGMPLEQMIEMTRNLNWKKFSRLTYSRLGYHSNKPMGAFLTDVLGDVNIEDAKIPLAIVATNIETHRMVTLRSGSLREAVRASTCIPGFFTPVEIDGALLVDGGLTENLPISALEEMGATMKIGINLVARPMPFRPKNLTDIINASFTILSLHRDRDLPRRTDVLIEPDLNQFDSSKFKNIDDMFEEGYQAALKAIPAIKAKIRARSSAQKFSFSKFLSRFIHYT